MHVLTSGSLPSHAGCAAAPRLCPESPRTAARVGTSWACIMMQGMHRRRTWKDACRAGLQRCRRSYAVVPRYPSTHRMPRGPLCFEHNCTWPPRLPQEEAL